MSGKGGGKGVPVTIGKGQGEMAMGSGNGSPVVMQGQGLMPPLAVSVDTLAQMCSTLNVGAGTEPDELSEVAPNPHPVEVPQSHIDGAMGQFALQFMAKHHVRT